MWIFKIVDGGMTTTTRTSDGSIPTISETIRMSTRDQSERMALDKLYKQL